MLLPLAWSQKTRNVAMYYRTLTLPLLATIFMHGIILAIILINVPDAKPLVKKAATKYIDARLVVLEKPKAKQKAEDAPAKAKPADSSKVEEQAKLKAQQEQQRAEQARLQQQRETQAKARQAKQQQEELARQQAKQQEQARIAEQQRRLKEQQKREFAELIEQEAAVRQAESDADLANSYIALITKVIQNNWSRPPSARNSMEAELALQLVPTGEVVSVRVVNGSGNAAFDRSAEKAVLRAGRFPELQQLPPRVFEQYFRRLNLRFKPEDLRL